MKRAYHLYINIHSQKRKFAPWAKDAFAFRIGPKNTSNHVAPIPAPWGRYPIQISTIVLLQPGISRVCSLGKNEQIIHNGAMGRVLTQFITEAICD